MKKIAAICLLLVSLHARADLTIVEHVETDPQFPQNGNQDFTVEIKGGKARLDAGSGQFSAIIDTDTGDAVGIMHPMKTFVKVSGDQIKMLIEQGKKRHDEAVAASGNAADAGESDAPKIVDTGKQEKVGDYNAEIYTIDSPHGKVTLWVSKEVPDYATIQQLLKKALDAVGKLGLSKIPDVSGIDGVAVKIQTEDKGRTNTVSLVSVKQDPVADADFQPPAGYVETQISQLMGGMVPPPQQRQPAQLQQQTGTDSPVPPPPPQP